MLGAALAVPASVRAQEAEAGPSQVRSCPAVTVGWGAGGELPRGLERARQVPRRLQGQTLDVSPSASIVMGGSGVLGLLLRAVSRWTATRRRRRDTISRRLAEPVQRVLQPTTDRLGPSGVAQAHPNIADNGAAAFRRRSPGPDASWQRRVGPEPRRSVGEPAREAPMASPEGWAHLGPAPAFARTVVDDPGDELGAVVEELVQQVDTERQHLLTDISLLVNAAAGRLSQHWRYFSHDLEIRRRRFDPAFVWAAAWLAVRRRDIDHRHQLVITALDYCQLSSLDEGLARYAAAAIEGCRRRLEVTPAGRIYGQDVGPARGCDGGDRDFDRRHIG